MLLNPRFGSRMWSGIWPPSKPAMLTPDRALAPFCPRPAVLPSPEPMPRPTRTRPCRAPLLSLSSLSFMSLHSLSLLSRYSPLAHGGRGRLRLAFHLQQMLHLADLAEHFGRALHFDGAAQLVEAETDQRRPLRLVAADRRAGLGDLDLRHWCLLHNRFGLSLGFRCSGAAAAEQVGDLLAATLGNRARAGLLFQRLEGGADHVVRVGRADRLGHDVGNAEALENRAHRAAGDDACAGRSRSDGHKTGAEVPEAVVMQCAAVTQRDADHRLLRRCGCLRNRLRDFAGLAVAETRAALAVTDYDQRGEAEALAALHR